MFDLSGKKALVTGASGGIGEQIVKTLSAQGAKLAISGRNEEKLQKLAFEIGGAEIIAGDLGNKEDVLRIYQVAEEKLEGIDILVCNAGLTKDGLVLRMSEEDFSQVLDVNLKSTFLLNKEAIKKMMRRKFGRIINIASVVAFSGNPGQANYVASKAGMVGMSKSLAQEVASRGITINCIAPGFIATNMTDILNDTQKESILKNIPTGKMGLPSDIAAGVVYLASNEGGYVTGTTLHINGGLYTG